MTTRKGILAWTLAEDVLDDGRRIATSWSLQPFSSWGICGEPVHYQTVIVEADGHLGASWEYACEREALIGHRRVFLDLSRQVGV
jgi:hypothetical protein